MFLANKLAGSGVAPAPAVEDYFRVAPYNGSGAQQEVKTDIDFTGTYTQIQGGMLWFVTRSGTSNTSWIPTYHHTSFLNNTAGICTNSNAGAVTDSTTLAGTKSTTGVVLLGNTGTVRLNKAGESYSVFAFKERAKFFSIWTNSGNGNNRDVAHNLGVVPGAFFCKAYSGTSATATWLVYHKDLGYSQLLDLGSTAAAATDSTQLFGNPISTAIKVGGGSRTNGSGTNYFGFMFADDTSADGFVRCGSYNGNGSTSGPTVDTGWEPQWLLVKNATGVGSWHILDTSRGLTYDGANLDILAESTAVETSQNYIALRPNGFQVISSSSEVNTSGATYIYVAIRKGTKTPTSGNQVLQLQYNPASSGFAMFGTTVPAYKVDMVLMAATGGASTNFQIADRVRGFKNIAAAYPTNTPTLVTSSNAAEYTSTATIYQRRGLDGTPDFMAVNAPASADYINYGFKRSRGVFDIVAYNGNSGTQTIKHNLGVVPELVIFKDRGNASTNFITTFGHTSTTYNYAGLNTVTSASINNSYGSSTCYTAQPTTTGLPLGYSSQAISPNLSGAKYVGYLFATLAGISKVGTYSGNATSRTIDCGFSGGARLALIKRLDTNSDWYLFDSARGITSGADPALLLNSTAAQSTANDIGAASAGFALDSGSIFNVNGASYLYVAFA